MNRVLRVTLVVGLIAAACGSSRAPVPPPAPGGTAAPPDAAAAPAPDAAPLPLDRDLATLAARSLRLYQDLAAAFGTSGEDCAAAAAALRDLQRRYADVVTANAKVLHEGRGGELAAALAPHDAALDAAARQIVGSPTLAKCVNDPAFTQAYDELVGATSAAPAAPSSGGPP